MARAKKRDARKERSRTGGVGIRRFALTYVILMGLFFLLIGLRPIQEVIDLNGLYTSAVVSATTKVLKAAAIPSTAEGSLIRLPALSLDVKFGCNGLEAVMIYSVAVIAFPAPWYRRLIGIVAGFLVIQVVNIVRIAGLAYTGVRFREAFEYVHIYVAQGMMIAVSLAVFFLYLRYVRGREAAAA